MSGDWERWSNPPRGREPFHPSERSVNTAGDNRFGNNVMPRPAPTESMLFPSALSMFGNQDRDDRKPNPSRGPYGPPHATWQNQPDLNNSRNAQQGQVSQDVPQSQRFSYERTKISSYPDDAGRYNESSKQRLEIGPLGYQQDVDIRREKPVQRIDEPHIKEEYRPSSLTSKATVEDDYDDFEKYLDAELDQNPKIHSGVTEKDLQSMKKRKDFQDPYDPYEDKRVQYSPSGDYDRGHREKRFVSPHQFAARHDANRADVSSTIRSFKYETAKYEQDRPRSPMAYKHSPNAGNWSPSQEVRHRSPVGYNAEKPRQRSIEGEHKKFHEKSAKALVDYGYDEERSRSPKVKIAEEKLAKFSGLLADLICKDGIFKNYSELAHRNRQSDVPIDQGQYPYPSRRSRSKSPIQRKENEIPALGDIPGRSWSRAQRSRSLSPRRSGSPGRSSLGRRRNISPSHRSPGRSPVRRRSTERYTDLNQYRNKSRSRSTSRGHSPGSRYSPDRRRSGHRHSRSPRIRRSTGRRSISPRRALSDRRSKKRSNSPASDIRSKRSRDGSVRSRSRSRDRRALHHDNLDRFNRTRSKSPSFRRSPSRKNSSGPRDARDLIRNRSRTSRSPLRDVVTLGRNRSRSISPLHARSPLRRPRYSQSPDRRFGSSSSRSITPPPRLRNPIRVTIPRRSISPRRSVSPFYDRGHLGRMNLRSRSRSFSRSRSPGRPLAMGYSRSYSRSFSRSISLSPPRLRSDRWRSRERHRNSTWDSNTGTWKDNTSLTGSEYYSSLDSLYSLSSVEYDTDKMGVNLKKPDSSKTNPSKSKESSKREDYKITKKGSKSSKSSQGKTTQKTKEISKDSESKPVEQANKEQKIDDTGPFEPAKDALKEQEVTGDIPKERVDDPPNVEHQHSKTSENVKSEADAKYSIPDVQDNKTSKTEKKQISDKRTEKLKSTRVRRLGYKCDYCSVIKENKFEMHRHLEDYSHASASVYNITGKGNDTIVTSLIELRCVWNYNKTRKNEIFAMCPICCYTCTDMFMCGFHYKYVHKKADMCYCLSQRRFSETVRIDKKLTCRKCNYKCETAEQLVNDHWQTFASHSPIQKRSLPDNMIRMYSCDEHSDFATTDLLEAVKHAHSHKEPRPNEPYEFRYSHYNKVSDESDLFKVPHFADSSAKKVQHHEYRLALFFGQSFHFKLPENVLADIMNSCDKDLTKLRSLVKKYEKAVDSPSLDTFEKNEQMNNSLLKMLNGKRKAIQEALKNKSENDQPMNDGKDSKFIDKLKTSDKRQMGKPGTSNKSKSSIDSSRIEEMVRKLSKGPVIAPSISRQKPVASKSSSRNKHTSSNKSKSSSHSRSGGAIPTVTRRGSTESSKKPTTISGSTEQNLLPVSSSEIIQPSATLSEPPVYPHEPIVVSKQNEHYYHSRPIDAPREPFRGPEPVPYMGQQGPLVPGPRGPGFWGPQPPPYMQAHRQGPVFHHRPEFQAVPGYQPVMYGMQNPHFAQIAPSGQMPVVFQQQRYIPQPHHLQQPMVLPQQPMVQPQQPMVQTQQQVVQHQQPLVQPQQAMAQPQQPMGQPQQQMIQQQQSMLPELPVSQPQQPIIQPQQPALQQVQLQQQGQQIQMHKKNKTNNKNTTQRSSTLVSLT